MSRIFQRAAPGSLLGELTGRPGRPWRATPQDAITARLWRSSGNGLPENVALTLQSTGLPELRDLHVLAVMPDWDFAVTGDASHRGLLVLAANDAGLCVIVGEAVLHRLEVPLRVHANTAVATATAFHAKTAVVLVHVYAESADARQQFDELSLHLGAPLEGNLRMARGANPALALAWCDDAQAAEGSLWDPARIPFPAM